jgi:hypothetical protein
MQYFQRRLENLNQLAAGTPPQWWSDLLSLWRPSGHSVGAHGLRLAIRNNYMNFYRKGQSVAAVSINADGEPIASLHHKYVDQDAAGQEYVTLGADGRVKGKSVLIEYAGMEMLQEWIERAESYAANEKKAVDEIVARNDCVIDLEMGLPGTAERHYAPRMDIVALESRSGGAQIAFWEAKMVADGRLRSQTEPEVLKQLQEYEHFAREDITSGRHAVRSSYQNVCALLVRLSRMAGDTHLLGDLVRQVAASKLTLDVDPKPRLVVVKDDARRNEAAWEGHAQKLRAAGVTLKILQHGGSYAL